MTMIMLCTGNDSVNIESILGLFGGIVGVIAGLWALWDRYKNRKPNIKVFAPYQWIAPNASTGKYAIFIYFRFSNLSQTPTYLFLETLKTEIYCSELQKWEAMQNIKLMTEKIQTDFSEEKKIEFGIDKAKYLTAFDECIVKYGEPLCGYLIFNIKSNKYSKIRGSVMDSRHEKIEFEIDFEKQKKHDPNNLMQRSDI